MQTGKQREIEPSPHELVELDARPLPITGPIALAAYVECPRRLFVHIDQPVRSDSTKEDVFSG